jgi:hypothetical protein
MLKSISAKPTIRSIVSANNLRASVTGLLNCFPSFTPKAGEAKLLFSFLKPRGSKTAGAFARPAGPQLLSRFSLAIAIAILLFFRFYDFVLNAN